MKDVCRGREEESDGEMALQHFGSLHNPDCLLLHRCAALTLHGNAENASGNRDAAEGAGAPERHKGL
eukprot:365977-Chlamydomonas_euryale.AAC.7